MNTPDNKNSADIDTDPVTDFCFKVIQEAFELFPRDQASHILTKILPQKTSEIICDKKLEEKILNEKIQKLFGPRSLGEFTLKKDDVSEYIVERMIHAGKKWNPYSVGKIGEINVMSALQQAYPEANIRDVSSVRGMGDIYLDRRNCQGEKILVEVKNTSDKTMKQYYQKYEERLIQDIEYEALGVEDTQSIVRIGIIASNSQTSPHDDICPLKVNILDSKIGKCVIGFCSDISYNKHNLYNCIEICENVLKIIKKAGLLFPDKHSTQNKFLELTSLFIQQIIKNINEDSKLLESTHKNLKKMQNAILDTQNNMAKRIQTLKQFLEEEL